MRSAVPLHPLVLPGRTPRKRHWVFLGSQKKWDGTIRVASHAEQLHEAIFNHLDGFSITMGMNVVCCQVSNTEGKQFQVKQAIA